MIENYNVQNEWEEHYSEKYTYFTFSCIFGAVIVEPIDGRWFWQTERPDDSMIWDDAIYELEELKGWWGYEMTKEDAKTAALKALGAIA